jgi:hypothetical protein
MLEKIVVAKRIAEGDDMGEGSLLRLQIISNNWIALLERVLAPI